MDNGINKATVSSVDEELSQEDIDLITYEIMPLAKKGLYVTILIFLIMAFIIPFSSKNGMPSAGATGNYWEAFTGFLIFGSVYIAVFIVRPLLLLKMDFDSNRKKTIELEVLKKIRTNNEKFVIKCKKSSIKLKGDIILDKAEFYNWWKGDKLIVDYLIRTKLIIGFKKIDTSKESSN